MGYYTVPADYYSSAGSSDEDHTFMAQTLKTFPYYWWDKSKTTGCVCDPGYGDSDCSKMTCPYATDVMAVRPDLSVEVKNQKQSIYFVNDLRLDATDTATMNGKSFALSFKSKLNETFTTRPLVIDTSSKANFQDFLLNVQFEMMLLPTKVIDKVKVTGQLISLGLAAATPVYFQSDGITLIPASATGANTCSANCNVWPPAFASGGATDVVGLNKDVGIQVVADIAVTGYTNAVMVTSVVSYGFSMNFEFTGDNVQGPQNLLMVKAYKCGDGCSPKVDGLTLRPQSMVVLETQKSDLNSYECGRRGKCDYTTGMCTCFSGYTGASCNIITALV